MIIYELLGPPIALKRPRICGQRFFDPQRAEKKNLQKIMLKHLEDDMPYAKALKITIEFHMPIPQSWSNRKRLKALETPHTTVPDLSNLIKFIEDALNDIIWKDDKIIYEIHARKFYSDKEKTRIIIQEYDNEKLWRIIPE